MHKLGTAGAALGGYAVVAHCINGAAAAIDIVIAFDALRKFLHIAVHPMDLYGVRRSCVSAFLHAPPFVLWGTACTCPVLAVLALYVIVARPALRCHAFQA